VRPARAIQCGWHPDHKQVCIPGINAPSTKVEHAAYEQGANRGMGLKIGSLHDGHASPLL
jgi:hypothetical protein